MANKVFPILLIGAGALYLGSRAFNATQAVGKLTATGARIKKINFKGLSIDVELEVQMQNPGSVGIPFEYYTGTITHAGTQLTNFTFNGQGKNVVIAARSITPLTFHLSISSITMVYKLVNLVKDIAAGKQVDTKLAIDSSLYAAGFDVPIKFVYDVKPGVISGQKVAGIGAVDSYKTINRTWFKNQLRKGNLLVKVTGKYTDDYAYDNEVNFHRSKVFLPAAPDLFSDWYLSRISIYGDKNGIIKVVFANSEYYEFVTKETAASSAFVGKPTARLEFDSNEDLAKHFGCPDRPKVFFSKN